MELQKLTDYELPSVEEVEELDMSPVELAGMVQNIVKEFKRRINHNMIMLGGYLAFFRDRKLYEQIGYETFGEWYQSIGLSRGTVYRSLNLYENIYKRFGIPEESLKADVKKIEALVPLINDGRINEENIEEWVEKAHDLSEKDFYEEINTLRGTTTTKDKIYEEGKGGYYILVKATGISDEDIKFKGKLRAELGETDDGEMVVKI